MSFEILILTKDRLPMLKDALESALRQTVSPVRITVIDNASRDGTAEYVKELSVKYNYVSIVSHLNPVSFAQNVKLAIELVTADYFILMHDDDILSPVFVESVCNIIKQEPSLTMLSVSQNAFTDTISQVEKLEKTVSYEIYETSADFVVSDYIRFLSNQRSSMCFPAIIYCRDCIDKSGPDMERFGKICDKPFVYASMGDGSIARVVTPLYNYRIHSGQDTANSVNGPNPHEILNLLKIQRKFFLHDVLTIKVFTVLSVRMMKSLYFWGRNPRKDWKRWFRVAKSKDLVVHSFYSRPWRNCFWMLWSKHIVRKYLRKHIPRTGFVLLKGG